MEQSVWTRKTKHFMEETSYAWKQRPRRILLPEEEGELSWGGHVGLLSLSLRGLLGRVRACVPGATSGPGSRSQGSSRPGTPSSGPRAIINAEASEINRTISGLQGAQSLGRGTETGPQWSVAG